MKKIILGTLWLSLMVAGAETSTKAKTKPKSTTSKSATAKPKPKTTPKPEVKPEMKPEEPKPEPKPAEETKPARAPAASLKPEQLKDFSKLPAATQEMLTYALSLTEKNLTYTYGSSDPTAGGMDCSGTVYHVVHKFGFTAAPRQSNQMYQWVWEAGNFHAVNGTTPKTFELKRLRPGDLMFWTNTVGSTDRDPPVTHVMMYLGNQVSDGKPVMFGASDGRSYGGTQRWGVSVFDFQLPKPESQARFIGYGAMPEK